jgi:NADH-ubiquinone oxidoreductase chain 1
MFFIGIVAETNRAPFDLAEAESELVSGFMTEHAAVIFVFFFLAEYASIVLMCIFTSILFFGGYLIQIDYPYLLYNYYSMGNTLYDYSVMRETTLDLPSLNGLFFSLILGVKTSIMVFVFI